MLLDFVPKGKGNAIRRSDLRKLCKISDRAMRMEILKTRKSRKADHTILNDQDGVGYYQPIFPDDYDKVLNFIRQEESRARNIFKGLRSARAFVKAVEKQKSGQMKFD